MPGHQLCIRSRRVRSASCFTPGCFRDFKTVCELSLKMNAALDGEPAVNVTGMVWTNTFRIRKALGSLWSAVVDRFKR